MYRALVLPVLVAGLALQTAPADAQSYSGAFERAYPEAAELLYGVDEVNAELLEALHADAAAAARLEGAMFDENRAEMLDGAGRYVELSDEMSGVARAVPRLAEIFDRTQALRYELYDIYADPRTENKYLTAEQAIDRYLQSGAALPATPKSFMIMHDQPYSMAFRMRAPRTNGLSWASRWLQFAVFDPMMYYDTAEERAAGIERVVERFEELLASSPQSTPQEMPTPAAISPELTRTHPRAAAIFDNLNMLHEVVADALANPEVSDKRAAISEALEMFADGEHHLVTNYNWLVGSLRHGIFFQGGPAIGRLERPERNMRGGHMDHEGGQMVMPGMPTGSGGGPSAPMPQGDDDQDHGVDHSQH